MLCLLIDLLFCSSSECAWQYKDQRGESAHNIQGTSTSLPLGQRWRTWVWTHNWWRTVSTGGIKYRNDRVLKSLLWIKYMSVYLNQYFVLSTDAYCLHKRALFQFNPSFRRQHRRGCAWIFVWGEICTCIYIHYKIKRGEGLQFPTNVLFSCFRSLCLKIRTLSP